MEKKRVKIKFVQFTSERLDQDRVMIHALDAVGNLWTCVRLIGNSWETNWVQIESPTINVPAAPRETYVMPDRPIDFGPPVAPSGPRLDLPDF